MTVSETAREFFEACETVKGWNVCKTWCHDGATFSCQADALADLTNLAGYTDWMKGLLGPIPDGHYELKAFAVDEERGAVVAAAVFHGTQTGGRQDGRSGLCLCDEFRRLQDPPHDQDLE